MTDLEKAARQALVALEKIASYRPLTFAECSDAEAVMGIAEKAIPTLREALAEQPAQQVVDSDEKAGAYMEARLWEFIDMAAAWPKASPDPRTWDHVMVYAPKPAQQEPVAWLDEYGNAFPLAAKQYSVVGKHWKPLYTSTPQRKPLTDDFCTWAHPDSDHMPDTWEASCGAMWTFTEGGLKDNDMHYCPRCGKPVIEAAHGIKGDA